MANIITEDRASGALVIDGCLKFDSSKDQHLERTPGSMSSDRKTWTWSAWVKRGSIPTSNVAQAVFGSCQDSNNRDVIRFGGEAQDKFSFQNGDSADYDSTTTDAVLRDTSWYHVVVRADISNGTQSERIKIYVNGELQSSTTAQADRDTTINQNVIQLIGARSLDGSTGAAHWDGFMSQVYMIDGQALAPRFFGFTDPLTGTWRPKKLREGDSSLNDGTVWSSGISGTQFNSSNPKEHAFDGNLSNWTTALNGTSLTWTPFGGLAVGSSLRLYAAREDATDNITVTFTDGSTFSSFTADNTFKWYDIAGAGEKTISNITWTHNNTFSRIAAIEVDGEVLTDSASYAAFGTNGFYLPMDGNSPIGEDKSGKGNDFTPVNFGGSVALDNPIVSGALPILNTDGGGNVARVGVRTDAYHANLAIALPLVGSATDVSNQINSGSTTKTTSDSTTHNSFGNFYGGSATFANDAKNDAVDYSGDLTLGTGDFTLELWVFRVGDGSQTSFETIFDCRTTDNPTTGFAFGFNSSGEIRTYGVPSGTGAISRGSGANNGWNHLAIVRGGGTIRVYQNGIQKSSVAEGSSNYSQGGFRLGSANNSVTSGDWNLNARLQDVRLYKGVAKYTSNFIPAATSPDILPDTPSGVSGSSKLTKITDGAVSFPDTGSGDHLTIADNADLYFGGGQFSIESFIYKQDSGTFQHWFRQRDSGSDEQAFVFDIDSSGGSDVFKRGYVQLEWASDKEFEGTNANISNNRWHHLLFTKDSGGTARIFVDGVLKGSQALGDPGDQSSTFYIGNYSSNNSYEYKGFMSNMRLVKGSIPTDYQTSSTTNGTKVFNPPTSPLTTTSQGATSNDVKLLCLQSNTSATAAAVTPGTITANGDAAATNFNPFNTDINTVRGQESGYATLNPLNTMGDTTLSDGNLHAKFTASASNRTCGGTIGVSTGNWYYEATLRVVGGSYPFCGFVTSTSISPGSTSNLSVASMAGSVWTGNGGLSAGDVVGNILDFSGKVGMGATYYATINGVPVYSSSSTVKSEPTELTEGYEWIPAASGVTNTEWDINFGQKPFKYAPPDGFQPLNAANVRPETVIARPDQFVAASIWTGDGTENRLIPLNMKPDLIWIKQRNDTRVHILQDSVRGFTKGLYSNDTDTESTRDPGYGEAVPGGFEVSDGAGSNVSGRTMVAWNWKAGGATVSNSDGSITTQVSANQDAGFSIVSYTVSGTSAYTTGHGLSQAPEFILWKSRSRSASWSVYHKDIGNNKVLRLDTTAASSTSGSWNNTTPTSSVVSHGGYYDGDDIIYYAWHSVEGFSKFGSYVGNNDADGTYVELGFRPAIIIIKSTSGGSWVIKDNARKPVNPNNSQLYLNTDADDDDPYGAMDFLSNGFKSRVASQSINASETYIFAAFAESPTFNLYGAQSNAR